MRKMTYEKVEKSRTKKNRGSEQFLKGKKQYLLKKIRIKTEKKVM